MTYYIIQLIILLCVFVGIKTWLRLATRNNLPTVEGLPWIGSIFFPWGKLPEMTIELSRKFNTNAFQINIFGERLIAVTDSATVKHIMKSDDLFQQTPEAQNFRVAVPGPSSLEGEVWLRHHNAIVAVIQRKNLMKMVPAMEYAMDDMLKRWKENPRMDLSCYEVFHDMKAAVIKSLIVGMFDVSLSHDQAYEFAMANFNKLRLTYNWFMSIGFSVAKCNATIKKYVDIILKNHEEKRNENIQKIQETVPPEEVRETVETLCFTGHDSTSITLSSVMHFLAKNQQLQYELRESLTDLSPEGVMRNKLLEGVVKETMRMMPIGAIVARTPKKPYNLNGCLIMPGETILLAVWALHHNPEYWPNPEKFDPTRFMKGQDYDSMNEAENIAYPTNFAYIPFSGGRRTCTGQQLAIFQLMQMTAHLLTKIHVRIPKEVPEIESEFSWSRRPTKGVYLDIQFLPS